MEPIIRKLILLAFFCFPFISLAQQGDFFLLHHINSQNGLPQNTIRDAVFSPTGYLWLATEDGLVRYSGKSYNVYSQFNSGLAKTRINQIILFNDNRLYCVTEGDIVYEIKELSSGVRITAVDTLNHLGFSSFHLFKTDSLPSFKKICQLLVSENLELDFRSPFIILDHSKKIVQRVNQGFAVYDSNRKLINKIKIPNSLHLALFQQNGNLYYKTPENTFCKIDLENGVIMPLICTFPNPSPLQKNKATLNDGKLFWNYKTNNTYFILNNILFEVCISKNNVSFIRLTHELPNYTINNVLYNPKNQILILGTLSDGAYIYRKKVFDIKLSPNGDNIYYAQINYPDHQSILTTRPFQEFTTQNKINYIQKSPSNEITLYLQNKNTLWCCDADTLESILLTSLKKTRRITIPGNEGRGIGFLCQRDSTSIYLSSNKSLFYYKIDSGLVKLADYNMPKINRVYCVLPDGDSVIYIGTNTGIFKYTISLNTVTPSYLQNKIVRCFLKTRNNIILVGTYGNGYYAIHKNKAIPIPLDKNKNLIATHTFIEDKNGHIWMSSNSGLYKIKLEEITNYLSNSQNNYLYYYRYSHVDGLLTNEFNGGCYPNSVQLDTATWSLPSMRGLVWFRPNQMPTTFNNNAIYIDHVNLNDQQISLPDTPIINTQKHNFRLTLHISAPNWSDENNLYIEYKLDDENQWRLLNDNTSPILIQNLHGGSHILSIRKKTGDLLNSYSTLKIQILVPKLIYEYWWFWPISIITLLLTTYVYTKRSHRKIQQRKNELEKQVEIKTIDLKNAIDKLAEKNQSILEAQRFLEKENKMKSNLLNVLSHDIANPLRFINLFLANLTKTKETSPLFIEDLTDLKISAQQLETLFDNIVEWIKQHDQTSFHVLISQINLHDLVQEKINLYQLTCKKKNIQINNHLPNDSITNSDKFIVSMAIQNILGNAINYTKNGKIEINFLNTPSEIQLIIKDEGIGMKTPTRFTQIINNIDIDHSLLGYGIGLKVTRELLKLINGEIISTSSNTIKGTTTTLLIRKM